MNTDGKVLKLTNSLFSFILACFYAGSLYASDIDTQVIANPTVNQDTITERQLRRVFMLKQRSWDDGAKISLIVFSNEDAKHALFLRQSLKLFPYQLEREWNKLIYSGQSAPPVIAADTQTMLEIVSSTPGAIGYLVNNPNDSTENLVNDLNYKVKTLKVIVL